MYHSHGYIGQQSYFPDIRSVKYVEVCANYILLEVLNSAPVKVIVQREGKYEEIQKLADRLYKVSIPKKGKLEQVFLLSWYFSLCIVRFEIHGCLFDHELFAGSSYKDIKELSDAFNKVGILILNEYDVELESVQSLLFLVRTKNEVLITE